MSDFYKSDLQCHPVNGGPPEETPWGEIQDVVQKGPMAWIVSTPSHGGIWVTAQGMALIAPAYHKNVEAGCGWFEEDDEYAIPYVALELHQYGNDTENGAKGRAQAIAVLADVHNATPDDVCAKKKKTTKC